MFINIHIMLTSFILMMLTINYGTSFNLCNRSMKILQKLRICPKCVKVLMGFTLCSVIITIIQVLLLEWSIAYLLIYALIHGEFKPKLYYVNTESLYA